VTAPERPTSRNIFKRFKADVLFAGSNHIQVVQPVSPEVQQLLREVRAALARIEERLR
jgi:hypothetical protein